MNGWCFEPSHIQSWARFSGDYNPIHFDLEKARRAGIPSIVVHGMLPLLYIKRDVSRLAQTRVDADEWLRIRCRLKSPLPLGASHDFQLKADGDRGRFCLSEQAGDTEYVQGSYSIVGDITESGVAETIELSADDMRQKLDQFSALFPDIQDLWIAVDSVAYARIMASNALLRLLHGLELVPDARNQDELMEQTLAMQTAHSVTVSPRFLDRHISEHRQFNRLRVCLGHPVVLRNGDAELSGSDTFDIFIDDELAMQCEVGFILKPLLQLSN